MVYIAFEGAEGSGKSTQASILAQKIDAVLTREPGATPLGKGLRSLLLNRDAHDISPTSEALLMAADRAQTLRTIVEPTISEGKSVITDRSVYSSMAYQGGGRGLGIEFVRELNEASMGETWPDIVVFIDVHPSEAMGRLNRGLDRFETAGDDFHIKVYEAYKAMADQDPERFIVIDGVGSIDEISDRVWAAVENRL